MFWDGVHFAYEYRMKGWTALYYLDGMVWHCLYPRKDGMASALSWRNTRLLRDFA
jgi:hypothetical protein